MLSANPFPSEIGSDDFLFYTQVMLGIQKFSDWSTDAKRIMKTDSNIGHEVYLKMILPYFRFYFRYFYGSKKKKKFK